MFSLCFALFFLVFIHSAVLVTSNSLSWTRQGSHVSHETVVEVTGFPKNSSHEEIYTIPLRYLLLPSSPNHLERDINSSKREMMPARENTATTYSETHSWIKSWPIRILTLVALIFFLTAFIFKVALFL